MKLFTKNKKTENTAVYERRCDCCNRKFSTTYRYSDYYSYKSAKEMVDSYYGTHKLFCNDTAAVMHTA